MLREGRGLAQGQRKMGRTVIWNLAGNYPLLPGGLETAS